MSYIDHCSEIISLGLGYFGGFGFLVCFWGVDLFGLGFCLLVCFLFCWEFFVVLVWVGFFLQACWCIPVPR